eukprot:scaffold66158_cov18-Tisochrysis_lutea.AAC.1
MSGTQISSSRLLSILQNCAVADGLQDGTCMTLYLPARAAKQKGACHQMKSTYRLFAFHAMMDTTDVATLQRLMEVSAGDVLAQ